MLWNDHANFCTIPLKSETHDTMSHTGIEPPLRSLGLSSFLDKTPGLFQRMDYFPIFPTGIEPLSRFSSSNKTNGLSQNKDSVLNDYPAITTSSFLQHYVPMNATLGFPNDSPVKQRPIPYDNFALVILQICVPAITFKILAASKR
jgi:hypothetical protein